MKQRPLSPFMIGPYYRPQLTSMLSITHRATGVLLGLVGAPLLLLWIIAVSRGPENLNSLYALLASWPGKLLSLALLFSLCFHFCNGIRHLIWDTGRMLQIDAAYRAGYVVLATALISTLVLAGVLL
ncbi:MAG: succinate dehydrogenase, cytochrome b556 subunit [Xanthomonadales bacterium]|nr:succinate dehydrogenase, cytochrome b556 subunit [Xanthomonadales bacterium]